MTLERMPFKVIGLDLIEKIESFFQERVRVSDIWHKYAVSKGGSGAVFSEHECIGIEFLNPEIVPKQWYHPKWMDNHEHLKDSLVPRRYKSEWKELVSLPKRQGQAHLALMLGYSSRKNCPPGPNHGYIVGQVVYLEKNGTHYLSIPTYYFKQHPAPEGLEEIKLSEWNALCEEENSPLPDAGGE